MTHDRLHAELIGLLKEARKIIRASSSRGITRDWQQRATLVLAKADKARPARGAAAGPSSQGQGGACHS